MLASTELVLPPLDEQRRIAAILDKVDTLMSVRAAVEHSLDELSESIFLEMFGDPTASSRWPVSTVGGIAASSRHAIVDGPFGSALKPSDYMATGIPVIRIKNITSGGQLNAADMLYIGREKFETLRRSSLRPDDVLVSRVGTLGNSCVFPDGIGDALLSTTGVCKVTVDRTQMLPFFLHRAFRTQAFQAQIQASASTSVQKYFNLTALKGWKIITPPLDIQAEFVQRLAAISAVKSTAAKSGGVIADLQASLRKKAFRDSCRG
jgi:type I restriction enzyme S subunit